MRRAAIILVVLSISVAIVLSGCMSNSGDSNTTPSENSQNREVTATNTEGGVLPAGQYPIVKDKVTLKVMMVKAATIENFETNAFTKWYEEQTNVHIDWEIVDPKDAQQQLNLVLTSGDYPDVFMGFNITPAQQMVYGSQGVFVPLNDYIDKYGFGVHQMFKAAPQAQEAITAPDGNIYGLPSIDQNPHTFYPQKMWIYKPWLEKLNLEMPTTTEDFYQVLKAFKTQDPNGNGKPDEIPLSASTDGWHFQIDGYLMSAFVPTNKTGNNYLILNNGKIEPVFNKPEWKQGLEYIHKLYAEGLLAPESFTQDLEQLRRIGENPDVPILGASPGGTMGFTQVNQKSDRWLQYTTIPPLEGPGGIRVAPYSLGGVNANAKFVITNASKHPEVAFRLADMMYTKEVTMRNSFGRPGEEWKDAEPGEKGLNGEQGVWNGNALSTGIQNVHWEHTGPILLSTEIFGGRVVREGELAKILFDETVEKYNPYGQNPDSVVPPLFFSSEQATELASLQKTIYDFVTEKFAQFVTGSADINAKWDSYVKELDNMGLDRFLKIYQEAYDSTH